MKTVSKADQKFIAGGREYTVFAFFGSTGVEYKTVGEAIQMNPPGSRILVKNREYSGATELEYCILKE